MSNVLKALVTKKLYLYNKSIEDRIESIYTSFHFFIWFTILHIAICCDFVKGCATIDQCANQTSHVAVFPRLESNLRRNSRMFSLKRFKCFIWWSSFKCWFHKQQFNHFKFFRQRKILLFFVWLWSDRWDHVIYKARSSRQSDSLIKQWMVLRWGQT